MRSFSGSGQNCVDSPGSRGPCRAAFPKWTFEQGACKQFLYGGCRGNGNRFDSQDQCQAVCGGGRDGGGLGSQGISGNQGGFISGGTTRFASPCNQNPFVFGSCQSNLKRWTYVWQTRSCQPYIYSGCGGGGVQNRFSTWDQCARYCLP